jgi:hypothetical protein
MPLFNMKPDFLRFKNHTQVINPEELTTPGVTIWAQKVDM